MNHDGERIDCDQDTGELTFRCGACTHTWDVPEDVEVEWE